MKVLDEEIPDAAIKRREDIIDASLMLRNKKALKIHAASQLYIAISTIKSAGGIVDWSDIK